MRDEHFIGSPYECGLKDGYYGLEFNPHYYSNPSKVHKYTLDEMTSQDLFDYTRGYREAPTLKNYEGIDNGKH